MHIIVVIHKPSIIKRVEIFIKNKASGNKEIGNRKNGVDNGRFQSNRTTTKNIEHKQSGEGIRKEKI